MPRSRPPKTTLSSQLASATAYGFVVLLVILVIISAALLFQAAWRGDSSTFPTFPDDKPPSTKPCVLAAVVKPTTDLLPWAVCQVRKEADDSNFHYGYGREDITYPHPDPVGGTDKVLKILYPKNSINPRSGRVGGLGFHTKRLPEANEAYIEYEVYFAQEFKWVKGGKLPGLYGGRIECAGGYRMVNPVSHHHPLPQPPRFTPIPLTSLCPSLMWRANSAGEAYLYVPRSEQHSTLFEYPPRTIADATYGISLGRGGFNFRDGGWTRVGIFVGLNDVDAQNGVLKVWIDDKEVVDFGKMVYRTQDTVRIAGVMFDTFFGGSKPGFEAAEDSYTYFKNLHIASAIPDRLIDK
ncbi:hypothetical protein BC938DRAFT_472746 [Jimgerdemannia flammicorona]|uniref:Polysaccharide lyase 14 domain-containing protein n=1 Tax=Jimgerdemannia flammicorona TaxID=994334 RepID=A0A433Q5H1_9FUNG|nr:hypothetical protein BC938DRAFT_472746 [Jimgerdemannia flammicorona]